MLLPMLFAVILDLPGMASAADQALAADEPSQLLSHLAGQVDTLGSTSAWPCCATR